MRMNCPQMSRRCGPVEGEIGVALEVAFRIGGRGFWKLKRRRCFHNLCFWTQRQVGYLEHRTSLQKSAAPPPAQSCSAIASLSLKAHDVSHTLSCLVRPAYLCAPEPQPSPIHKYQHPATPFSLHLLCTGVSITLSLPGLVRALPETRSRTH